MIRALPSLLVLTLILAWPIDKVERSLVKVKQAEGGQCTAFSIRESQPARWITMSHCLPEDRLSPLTVGDTIVTPRTAVIYEEHSDYGLAVIETGDRGVPPLKLGDEPKRGDTLLAIGYGANAPAVLFFDGVLIHPNLPFEGAVLQFSSPPGMPGMSGGPLIDRRGRVVGVMAGAVQPTPVPTSLAFGPPYAVLKRVMQTYSR